MPRTPKVVEDRREQIIDAAMRVFADKGFARATNRDIAQEAGITTGLIYHYFDSKEALLKAIVQKHSPAKLMRSLSPQMLALPPQVGLPAILRPILSMVEGERFVQLLRLFLPEVIQNPAAASSGLLAFHEGMAVLEEYFSAKMLNGELRQADPSLSAQVLMSSLVGFVLRRQILRDPVALGYSQGELIDSVVETVLRGLLPG
jgi:AcrR family transcriptional regulator